MTIDETIKYYENLAETNKNNIVPKEDYQNMPWIDESNEHYKKMALRYSLISDWLRELRFLRNVVEYARNYNCSVEQAEKNLLLSEMKKRWREEDD